MTERTAASAASTHSTAPAGGATVAGHSIDEHDLVGSGGNTAVGQRAGQHEQSGEDEGSGSIKAGHGNTPAAWSAVGLILVGFVVWAIGMVTGPNWVLVGIGVAILPLSVAVGWAMGRAGLGSTPH